MVGREAPRRRLRVEIDQEVWRWVREYAGARRLSVADVVRQALLALRDLSEKRIDGADKTR